MAALIFTPDRIAAARKRAPDPLDSIVVHWARDAGPAADRLRDQLEAAAGAVPETKRARVLGPVLADRDDDQVKAAVGGLFLAKMLADQGWSVEFEPELGSKTPDLRVSKPGVEYIVEVRRVVGRAAVDSRPRLLVTRALKDIRTASPLMIDALRVDPCASLRPLVRHVAEVLAARPLPEGRQQFQSPGVLVSYTVHPFADESIGPAVIGWPIVAIHGNDADRVEAAINEKLGAYKEPIIVALDLAGVIGEFDDVLGAFYGERKIHVPLRMGAEEPERESWLGPMQDGMLVGRDRNAFRARERLVALLPFSWGIGGRPGEGFGLHARLLANPATAAPTAFEEFAPVPRFLVGERRDADTVEMEWLPAVDPKGWRHVL